MNILKEHDCKKIAANNRKMMISAFQTLIHTWIIGFILFTHPSRRSTNVWPSSARDRKSRRIVFQVKSGAARGKVTDGGDTSANMPPLRQGCRRNAPVSRQMESFIPDWSRMITSMGIDMALAETEDPQMCIRTWPDILLDEVSHESYPFHSIYLVTFSRLKIF